MDIENAAALLHFVKGTPVQSLLHGLKYKQQPEIGHYFGEILGKKMKEEISLWQDVDVFVPVPLHPKKQKLRGYNQAEEFAKGLSVVTGIKIEQLLKKNVATETQTTKSRLERYKNMAGMYSALPNCNIYNHIVLVDDVITTGATLEACIEALRKEYNGKISVVSIAFA